MTRTLVVFEKSSQSERMAALLAKRHGQPAVAGYRSYTVGDVTITHLRGAMLRDLKPEEYDDADAKWRIDRLPYDPQEWRQVPRDDERAKALKRVRDLTAGCSTLVIATDPGRNGQAIGADALLWALGIKADALTFWASVGRSPGTAHIPTIKRFWASGEEEADYARAWNALLGLDDPIDQSGKTPRLLTLAAITRSRADWRIGMSDTVLETCVYGTKTNSGRVKNVILELVTRRQEEIEAYQPRHYYTLDALVRAETPNGPVDVTLSYQPTEDNRLWDRAAADALAGALTSQPLTLSVKTAQDRELPPRQFNRSMFIKHMGDKHDWASTRTSEAINAMYFAALTSYPRTDSTVLSEEQIPQIGGILCNLAAFPELAPLLPATPTVRKHMFNTAAIIEHPALSPLTTPFDTVEGTTADHRLAYIEIMLRYIAGLSADHSFIRTKIDTAAAGIALEATGRQIIDQGWRRVLPTDGDTAAPLPAIPDGGSATILAVTVVEQTTKRPQPYTDSSLEQELAEAAKFATDPAHKKLLRETSGIGTQATRTDIIAEVIANDLIVADAKRRLAPTHRGRAVNTLRRQHLPDTIDVGETAVLEERLEAIARGADTPDAFLNTVKERLKRHVAQLGPLKGQITLPAEALTPPAPLTPRTRTAAPRPGAPRSAPRSAAQPPRGPAPLAGAAAPPSPDEPAYFLTVTQPHDIAHCISLGAKRDTTGRLYLPKGKNAKNFARWNPTPVKGR